MFQSAWSGATYDIEGDKLEVEDKTIYMINDYGQLQAINKDLSGLEDEETKENQTELEAVIDHIESITTRLEIEEVKRPWLPPLPENVYQEDLVETDFRKLWSDDAKEVELTLGLKDVPEEQYQGPMVLQLKKAGHIALIGVQDMVEQRSYTTLFSMLQDTIVLIKHTCTCSISVPMV